MDYEEIKIREACRWKYIEEGCLDNPYPKGTLEYLVWDAEATKITLEKWEIQQ